MQVHDSEPKWCATPFLCGSLIRYSIPVYLGASLITLSARKSTDSGIVSPICFAAFRLILNPKELLKLAREEKASFIILFTIVGADECSYPPSGTLLLDHTYGISPSAFFAGIGGKRSPDQRSVTLPTFQCSSE